MALKFRQGIVAKKRIWAEGLFTLHVDVEGVQPFDPGQFLQVGITLGEKHVHRPYSVASPFGKTLEVYIVLVDDGELTPHLWKMQEGDAVDVAERAAGSFTLKKTPDAKNLWLVATGTGLAPYVAMLRTDEPWERYEKIVVVHGARLHSDLGYTEEFAEIKSKFGERFSYVPTLTRDDAEGTLKGRIPQLLESGDLERHADCHLNAESSAVMLCGNPAMLDDMEAKLGERQMVKHRSKAPGHIVLERYW